MMQYFQKHYYTRKDRMAFAQIRRASWWWAGSSSTTTCGPATQTSRPGSAFRRCCLVLYTLHKHLYKQFLSACRPRGCLRASMGSFMQVRRHYRRHNKVESNSCAASHQCRSCGVDASRTASTRIATLSGTLHGIPTSWHGACQRQSGLAVFKLPSHCTEDRAPGAAVIEMPVGLGCHSLNKW